MENPIKREFARREKISLCVFFCIVCKWGHILLDCCTKWSTLRVQNHVTMSGRLSRSISGLASIFVLDFCGPTTLLSWNRFFLYSARVHEEKSFSFLSLSPDLPPFFLTFHFICHWNLTLPPLSLVEVCVCDVRTHGYCQKTCHTKWHEHIQTSLFLSLSLLFLTFSPGFLCVTISRDLAGEGEKT